MLIEDIKKANIEAMKRRDQNARTAFSMIISRYQGLLTSGSGKEVGDADVVRLITKFCKELDEELEQNKRIGRSEEAEAVLAQKQAVEAFLPKMLSEEEIRAIIASLEDRSMPAVMKHFKANYDGQADMGLVSKIARLG